MIFTTIFLTLIIFLNNNKTFKKTKHTHTLHMFEYIGPQTNTHNNYIKISRTYKFHINFLSNLVILQFFATKHIINFFCYKSLLNLKSFTQEFYWIWTSKFCKKTYTSPKSLHKNYAKLCWTSKICCKT
jgi:hypothetical protein